MGLLDLKMVSGYRDLRFDYLVIINIFIYSGRQSSIFICDKIWLPSYIVLVFAGQ